MHFLIKVLVPGANVTEALQNAHDAADDMTNPEFGTDFDWYNMDGDRWSVEAHKVTSKRGKELIKEGMEGTRREFNEAIKTILYTLENFSDDEIFNEDFQNKEGREPMPEGVHYLSRWQFGRVGHHGTCYLYAPNPEIWGGRVENDKDLKSILDNNKNLWVVPIDFHQ